MAAAVAAHGIELVDEHDARGMAPRVAEERRTREAPTPAYISTKSEPLANTNGTPASPAIDRASSVLPMPGGPTSSTPFGMRPPTDENRFGSRRKSTISETSSFASSTPATSAKVTTARSRDASRACVSIDGMRPAVSRYRAKPTAASMSRPAAGTRRPIVPAAARTTRDLDATPRQLGDEERVASDVPGGATVTPRVRRAIRS